MNQLLKHFDVAIDAPDGVKKLRELILTLAMQGKLVPQDPQDQPASELLKEIEAEKKRLVKAGKIKEPKPLPPIKPEEIPYGLPKGWEWVRLINIGVWAIGSGFPNSIQGDCSHAILLCKVSDMNLSGNEKFIRTSNHTISEELAAKYRINIHEPGTIVYPKIGGAIATNKRRILAKRTAIDNNCLGIKPYSHIDLEWAYRLHVSFDFSKYQSGTSVPAISQGVIGEIVIGLPPLAEQKRIVAKIDQLMAQCDELEKQRAAREQKRVDVHTSAITQLLEAKSDGDFKSAWGFLQKHFGELYSVKENVAELRKAILQLAVMGKLVPQDPHDQPASELLKEIEAEKKRLVKAGKIKEPKSLPPIKPEEIPYALPKGWEWVRFYTITINRDGERVPVSKEERAGMRGDFDYYGASGVIDKVNNFLFDKPLLLIGEDGANLLSRSTPIAFIAKGRYWVNNHAHVLDATCFELLCYLEKFINAIDLSPYVTGTAQPKMNQEKMNSILVSLPPIEEQRRIVEKIDQLTSFCVDLENQIYAASAKRGEVFEALLAGNI
jgi:type I restriction enzyme S subunit